MAFLTGKKTAKPPRGASASRAPADPTAPLHLLVVLVIILFLVAMLVLLPGCDRTPTAEQAVMPAPTESLPAAVPRGFDASKVARGAQVYKANCAACHGADAEGAPAWHRPGADGKYPAPPLNGTGHAWHHPKSVLVRTIKEGTLKLGGGMPGWRGKLSDEDIEAVIAWFQSRWPQEVYESWRLMDEKARRGRGGR